MWLLASVLFLASLGALELFWRAMGFTPSITDGHDLWALQREKVDSAPPATVVFLGSSRIQQEFVPEVFMEAAPGHGFIQLALGGLHPIATLRDIAEYTEFAGVVVCAVTAPSLLPELWEQQAGYLNYYYVQWNQIRKLARVCKNVLQGNLTVTLPDLLLQRVGPDLLRGEVAPQFLITRTDRTQTADYHRVDVAEFARVQYAQLEANLGNYQSLESYKRWGKAFGPIDAMVRRIQERGGQVVFVRMPTTGKYRELEEKVFPRAGFWDTFASQTSAASLHTDDIPEIARMTCAEGSHLFAEDARVFTQVLAKTLLQRGILAPPAE